MKQKSADTTDSLKEKSFADMLIELQNRAGLTGEQCAEKIDISSRCRGQYRTSKRHPDRYKLLEIAILFKCNLEETEALLRSCEFHFIRSSEIDQIFMIAIEKEAYDLDKIRKLVEEVKKAGKL